MALRVPIGMVFGIFFISVFFRPFYSNKIKMFKEKNYHRGNVFWNQWSSGNNLETCTIVNSKLFENKNHPSMLWYRWYSRPLLVWILWVIQIPGRPPWVRLLRVVIANMSSIGHLCSAACFEKYVVKIWKDLLMRFKAKTAYFEIGKTYL